MGIEKFIERAKQLIDRADEVLVTEYTKNHSLYVDAQLFGSMKSASLSFIASVFGTNHPYFKEFESTVVKWTPSQAKVARGILGAIHDELSGGWTETAKGLVSSEIFADFLEMADHLLDESYKDAAAVISGSVLEEHLRQLAEKNGIDTQVVRDGVPRPKKADLLNAELAKAGVFNKLDHKNVTAWLDLRNKAAHGHYDEYSIDQVRLMHQGIADFMVRVPV